MPRRPKRKFHRYSEESLEKALDSVRNGAKIRETCRNYGIPRATLQDRLTGRVASDKPRRMGPDPYLSTENEQKIVEWIIQIAKCGFPIKKEELILTVQKIVLETKVETPFKNGKPGQKWYTSFRRRHPEISDRFAESIDKSRAKLTEEFIKSWFRELENFLNSIDATDVLEDPTRIFNADESGFSLYPKTGKVLGPKGFKNLLEVKRGNEKENLTVLITFSADGKLCPPCIVYPYVKPPRAIAESMPHDWFLGKSDSGWMRSDVFYEYVANGLHQWILDNNIQKPVIFFVDGHRSHMSIELSQFCDENQIILYALPPNATHLIQPADVALFKPLKDYWRQAARNWQVRNMEKTLTKAEFAPIFKVALSNSNIAEHIKNGFRRCGLFPYNPEAVDYTKCVQNTLENIEEFQVIERVNQSLSSSDFKSTYKVLDSLKSNLNGQVSNIDEILEKIKLMEQTTEININNENSREDVVIAEYMINNDGTLSRLEAGDNNGKENNDFLRQPDILLEELQEPLKDADLIKEPVNEIICKGKNMEEPAKEKNIKEFLNEINMNESVKEENMKGPLKEIHMDESVKEKHMQEPIKENNINEKETNMDDSIKANIMDESVKMDKPLEKIGKPKIKILRVDVLKLPICNKEKELADENRPSVANNLACNSLELSIKPFVDIEKDEPTPTSTSLTDAFKKHLKYPKSIPKTKRSRAGPSTSAISSSVWRTYYMEKDRLQNEKEEAKKRKRDELERKKSEKVNNPIIKKKKGTTKEKSEILEECPKTEPLTNIAIKKEKCAVCEDELDSDAEAEGEKNVGCDCCPRWFHLDCTKLAGRPYKEVTRVDYNCDFCE